MWWAAFPDVLAFGPSVVAGVWLRFAGGANPGSADGHVLPHVHIGLPLYQAGHSLIVFLVVFALPRSSPAVLCSRCSAGCCTL